ncbi:MAG: hypothetical protein ACJA1P_001962 [Maribacter sp.]|jgi:hypothetical protein
MSRKYFLIFCFPFLFFLYFLAENKGRTEYTVISPQLKTEDSGKKLASIYCATCHKLPNPKSLDYVTWKNSVLPNMGLRLGLKIDGKGWDADMKPQEASLVDKLNVYPEYPLISEEDWSLVKKYYLENAPKSLPAVVRNEETSKAIFPFTAQTISIGDSKLPQVSLLRYDSVTSNLYIGDFKSLFVLDNTGSVVNTYTLDSPASHLDFDADGNPLLLTLGKLSPSDQSLGNLYRMGATFGVDTKTLFSSLKRPVNFVTEDLNADGKMDLVLCNFGHYGGTLSWFDNFDSSKEQVLNTLPGTRKVEISDFNKDGKPDIMALMTQAREQIIIYYNIGNNNFEERTVLSFDAVNGTSYFELADFNADGYQDIMVTNGDNRDYSAIDKPYHGIRIFLNDGNDVFEESFFYPMYDCGKAMVRDFDMDGDLDIIGASLYSEYTDNRNAKESIVYLENNGNLDFTPSYMEVPIHGNWLTMEVGDFNNDNRLDVMLGTFIYNIQEMMSISMNTGVTAFPQVLLLTNTAP